MAAVAIATQASGIDVAWLPPNTAMSRYGVSYLRTICGQAGLGFTETPPDEDHRAIDGSVDFDDGPVYAQVKATCGYKIRGKSISIPADPKWFVKWSKMRFPVYLVAVIIDWPQPEDWIEHQPGGTWHRSAAFWVRVDNLSEVPSINVPKQQRLDVETLATWKADFDAMWEAASGRST